MHPDPFGRWLDFLHTGLPKQGTCQETKAGNMLIYRNYLESTESRLMQNARRPGRPDCKMFPGGAIGPVFSRHRKPHTL
jgi:hypothetical protein